jgi:hypothetical protein
MAEQSKSPKKPLEQSTKPVPWDEPDWDMARAKRANREAEDCNPKLKAENDAARQKFAELKARRDNSS